LGASHPSPDGRNGADRIDEINDSPILLVEAALFIGKTVRLEMADLELGNLMASKDDIARSVIARRVGERLSKDDLSEVDRQAAEALAKLLVSDAVERVRAELSDSIKHAKYLPRDIAMRIAHDVNSVACPFLEITEVFSESDWQQLVLTISRTALVAVARRQSLSENLAASLAEIGDLAVAETLVENRAAPMTKRVCFTLMDRFESSVSLLDKMAQRNDLIVEIVVKLTSKVSDAAREKLLQTYNMPDHTEMIAVEAEGSALIAIIRGTLPAGMPALVRALRKENKLTDLLLLNAADENLIEFLVAGLADRATARLEQTRAALLHGGSRTVVDLLNQARVPKVLHDKFWAALVIARGKGQTTVH